MMDEVLRVTALGEFIWHPEADRLIEEGDFSGSPAMPFILKALRRKEWQGLTDEERLRCFDDIDWNKVDWCPDHEQYAKAIEAKLKEKNA
jgi:hypothetical protein